MKKPPMWFKMAGKGEAACSSCAMETKYICMRCKVHCCTRCSEMESDEDTPGWKAGKSVGYCEACFLRKLDELQESDQSETSSHCDQGSENCSGNFKQQLEKKIERLKELVNDGSSDEEEEDHTRKEKKEKEKKGKEKKGKEKKKPGRKSTWSVEAIDNFVDIIVNNNYYQKKLVFTNTKNQKNGEIYEKILIELKERSAERGEVIQFTVPQLRTKFKKCVSECKQAALTMKTATGIKRFQEERGFGKWFNALFALVKSRDSCKPELALEPSSLEKQSTKDTSNDDGKEGLFVPVKKKQKVKASDKLNEAAIEAINVVKDTLKNDPTKDLIAFMREEMDKSRDHELKLVGLMQGFRQSNTPYQIPQHLPSFASMPCGEGPPPSTTSYPSWNIAIGSHTQPAAYQNSDVSYSTITGSQPTTSGIHCDGKKTYQKL